MEEYLDNAWEKISEFCKREYSGVFKKDVHFRWFHDVYGWLEFGVTTDGIAFFVHGDHSTSCGSPWADYYHHPRYKKGYQFTYYRHLERIVRDWETIKEKLNKEASFYKNLEAFEA